jgi:hypothetical protein
MLVNLKPKNHIGNCVYATLWNIHFQSCYQNNERLLKIYLAKGQRASRPHMDLRHFKQIIKSVLTVYTVYCPDLNEKELRSVVK